MASRVVGGVGGTGKGSHFDVMIAAVTRTLAKIGGPVKLWKVDQRGDGTRSSPVQTILNHFLYAPTHVVSMLFRR